MEFLRCGHANVKVYPDGKMVCTNKNMGRCPKKTLKTVFDKSCLGVIE